MIAERGLVGEKLNVSPLPADAHHPVRWLVDSRLHEALAFACSPAISGGLVETFSLRSKS